jgi:hypothetical protein
MFFIRQAIVKYPDLKAKLLRKTWLVAVLLAAPFVFLNHHQAFLVITGGMLAYAYMLSMFFATEFPQRRLAIGLSIIRMATVSFLIVWTGQFKLLDTCVVFLGFLSYKIVLVLEFIRYSVGIKLHRGN